MSAAAAKCFSYLVIGNDSSIGNVEEKDHTECPHQNAVVEVLTSLGPERFGSSMATFTSCLKDNVVYYRHEVRNSQLLKPNAFKVFATER